MTEVKTIDRAGLVDIYETLAQAKGSLREVLHKFTAASLRKQLEVLVEPIIEQRTELEKSRPKEFDEEREALCKSLSAKDEKGQPIIAGNQYLIDPAKQGDFATALAALRVKHKEAIDKFDAEVKKFNEFLKGDIELPTFKTMLKLSWFAQSVDQSHLESLMPLIDADLDVVEALLTAKEEKAKEDAEKAAKK